MTNEKLFADLRANYSRFVQEMPREMLEREHQRFRQEMLNWQNPNRILSSEEKDAQIQKQKKNDEICVNLDTIEQLKKELEEKTNTIQMQSAMIKDFEEKALETEEMKERFKELLKDLVEGAEKVEKLSNEKSETIKHLEKELHEKNAMIEILTGGDTSDCKTCPLLVDQIENLKTVFDLFVDEKNELEQQNNDLKIELEAVKIGWQEQNAELQKQVDSWELEKVKIQNHLKEVEIKNLEKWERLQYLEYAFAIHDEECPYARQVKNLIQELGKLRIQMVREKAEHRICTGSYEKQLEKLVQEKEQLEQKLEDEREKTQCLTRRLARKW